ncbi:MAG: class I SAM-dependent methyltransferase [Pirellulaceae bacterium]|nr:class I SAM-dependent methyltransferase [Pirellulaceae bacterium]
MHNRIDNCRICGGTEFAEILNLGDQALTGVFPKSKHQPVPIGPLELVKCTSDCGLVQLRHSFPADQMYGDNYGYRSGLNASMVKHLQNRVRLARQRVELKPGDIVLDIGANDGTTLSSYGDHGFQLIGMDPSGIKFKQYYPPYVALIPDFFNAAAFQDRFGQNKAKIVTSIAMFYDLEDPTDFMRQVHECLDDEGIWVFEQSYLPLMVERNAYDTVCHEHVSYYALKQIQWMTERVGLKILDVELNDVNGGSFCVTVAKKSSKHQADEARVQALLDQEEQDGYNDLWVYEKFRYRVFKHRDALKQLVTNLRRSGKDVCGYGASTKGNVVLQFCEFTTDHLRGIAEVNEEKFGAFTPHNYIPIASEADIKAGHPDYMIVLPWHFRENILKREQAYLASGGNLIFPLPELEIVYGQSAAVRKAA